LKEGIKDKGFAPEAGVRSKESFALHPKRRYLKGASCSLLGYGEGFYPLMANDPVGICQAWISSSYVY